MKHAPQNIYPVGVLEKYPHWVYSTSMRIQPPTLWNVRPFPFPLESPLDDSALRPAWAGTINGILFRNAEAVEDLREVNTLFVDKTGTRTLGRPQLVGFVDDKSSENDTEALRLTASLEHANEHPLAEAIVTRAEDRGIASQQAENFESVTGQDGKGIVAGHRAGVGSRRFMDGLGACRGR